MQNFEVPGRIYRPATAIEFEEAAEKIRAMYEPISDGSAIAEIAALIKVEAFKDKGDADWRVRVLCEFDFISPDNTVP